MAHLGYARVSTDGQSLTAQVAALKVAGCTEIFQEKITGAKTPAGRDAVGLNAMQSLPSARVTILSNKANLPMAADRRCQSKKT